jgi:hypothetical protein
MRSQEDRANSRNMQSLAFRLFVKLHQPISNLDVRSC